MISEKKTNWVTQAIGLTSFTYLSQALSILLLPLITRTFTPEDFGFYAAFTSVLAITSVFSTWRYYLAIALPPRNEDSRDLIWGCFGILVAMTIVMATLALVVQRFGMLSELSATNRKIMELTCNYLPVSFLLTGTSILFTSWSMRLGNSIDVGVIRFIQVLATILIQLSLGRSNVDGPAALIAGMVLGQLAGVVAHYISFKRYAVNFFCVDADNAVLQLRNYSYLPATIVQTEFFNAVGKKALPVILASFFGAQIAGLWYFCNSILGNPIGVITGTIWQIAHNKLAREEHSKRNHAIALIHNFSSYLLALPIVIVIGFREYLPDILGEKWTELPLLIPMYALMLFVNSVSNTSSYFVLYKKYKQEGYYNVLLTVLPLVIVYLGSQYLDGFTSVYVYCAVTIFLYFGLNIYWGISTQNLVAFISNLTVSLCLNFAVMIPLIYLSNASLFFSMLMMVIYLIIYTKYILKVRFNVLRGI